MIWYKPGVSTQLAIMATCFSAFLLYVNVGHVNLSYDIMHADLIDDLDLGMTKAYLEVST
jgi:hypothetical protein